ncbi:hypothetical protein D3C76_1201150 [compost metagenome]
MCSIYLPLRCCHASDRFSRRGPDDPQPLHSSGGAVSVCPGRSLPWLGAADPRRHGPDVCPGLQPGGRQQRVGAACQQRRPASRLGGDGGVCLVADLQSDRRLAGAAAGQPGQSPGRRGRADGRARGFSADRGRHRVALGAVRRTDTRGDPDRGHAARRQRTNQPAVARLRPGQCLVPGDADPGRARTGRTPETLAADHHLAAPGDGSGGVAGGRGDWHRGG